LLPGIAATLTAFERIDTEALPHAARATGVKA
jgi:hypothetical protein